MSTLKITVSIIVALFLISFSAVADCADKGTSSCEELCLDISRDLGTQCYSQNSIPDRADMVKDFPEKYRNNSAEEHAVTFCLIVILQKSLHVDYSKAISKGKNGCEMSCLSSNK